MIRIGVAVEGREMKEFLEGMADRAVNLTPVFQGPIDRSVTEFFQKQFSTQGEHGGQRWAPLSPRTIKAKTGRGRGRAGPATILQDTRELWASLTKSGHPLGVRIIQPDHYERGTTVKKAFWAQVGANGAPVREIVPSTMPMAIVRGWEGMLERFITTGDT